MRKKNPSSQYVLVTSSAYCRTLFFSIDFGVMTFDGEKLKRRIEVFQDEYSMSPSYVDLFTDIYKAVKWHDRNSQSPSASIRQSIEVFYINSSEIYSIVFVAVLITIIRYFIERSIFTVNSFFHLRKEK